jgi:hypothetical protein
MHKFKTIKDAIQYRTYCPNCKTELVIHDNPTPLKQHDPLTTELHDDDCDIVIYKETNEIKSISVRKSRSIPIYSIGHELPVDYIPSPVFTGLFYNSISIECKECEQYYYVIKILFDLTNTNIKDIELNSETFSTEEYEIRSNCSTGVTSFQQFDKLNDPAVIVPYIEIDLDEPAKTVEKIKALIPFI